MAQEGRNRLVEWYEVLRKQVPVVRQNVADWITAVREEPRLLWETPAFRITTYVIGGLAVILTAGWLASSLVPPPPSGAKPIATTADFHVTCANPECHHHFVVHRRMGFRKFPIICSRCNQKSGMRARRCNSDTCRGRWIPDRQPDGSATCPFCGERKP